jgi:hypothetical protein
MFIGQKRRTPNGFAKCEAESDFKFVQNLFSISVGRAGISMRIYFHK